MGHFTESLGLCFHLLSVQYQEHSSYVSPFVTHLSGHRARWSRVAFWVAAIKKWYLRQLLKLLFGRDWHSRVQQMERTKWAPTILKVGVSDESSTLYSSGRNSWFHVPPSYGLVLEGWPLQKDVRLCLSLSFPLKYGLFLICPICRSPQLIFVFFRGKCSLHSCGFVVSVGEHEFRFFLCCLLDPEPLQ